MEPLLRSRQGALDPSVYGVIDSVSNIDGEIVPNVIRKWEGTIGNMVPSLREPTIFLVEKFEPFILKNKKYKCIYGGRGGMKSMFAQNVFVGDVNSAGTKCYVLRERMKSLKDSIYSGILKSIKDMSVGGFLPVPSKWEIRNSNGGGFVFGGMQNILDMKGASNFKRFLMEEAENTRQATIDILGPTLRGVENAELWYLWNPRSSNDPMSKEFIVPYQADIDRNGYYEDDYHLIMKVGLEDNPWFEHDKTLLSEYMKDKDKHEDGRMSTARFMHIWHGHFNDDVQDSLITQDMFDACVDAHIKLGAKTMINGPLVFTHDPSDTGDDKKGYALRQGNVYIDAGEIDAPNANDAFDVACGMANKVKADHFVWDCDGMGALLRNQAKANFSGINISIHSFKGSTKVDNPDATFEDASDYGVNVAKGKVTNADVFANKRAQRYVNLSVRCRKTWEAVAKGIYHNPDDLISFSSEIKDLQKLRAELCRMPIKPVGGGQICLYTKQEMRKGILMSDGSRQVIPSPNIGDCVMMGTFEPASNDDWLDIQYGEESIA